MTEINAKTKIRGFLSRFFRAHDLKDDEDMFSLGFVNSLFAMQLVMFIEDEFNIKIDDDDLEPDTFRTINNMMTLIENKVYMTADAQKVTSCTRKNEGHEN